MRTGKALFVAASVMVLCVAAASPQPILSNGQAQSDAQETANKTLAITWHGNVMGGDREAGIRMMDRNFIQHDVEEPSGSLEFVGFFTQPGGPPGPNGAPRTPENAKIKAEAEAAKKAGLPPPVVPPRPARPRSPKIRLAALTDGNLTMMIYATASTRDPGRFFGSNLMETKNGKVTQQWYSGPTFNSAAVERPSGTPDYSAWYPEPYAQVADVTTLIRINPATRAQREANKRLVADFWQQFFVEKKDVAGRYLSADLRNHIDDQPSGSAFAAFARANAAKVTAPDPQRTLFLIGDGDMVAIGFPVPLLGDPGAWYAQNLVRVKDGKIVEWWYSGYPTGTPALRYGASWPIGKGPRPGTSD